MISPPICKATSESDFFFIVIDGAITTGITCQQNTTQIKDECSLLGFLAPMYGKSIKLVMSAS